MNSQSTDSGWPAILTREQAATYLGVEPAAIDQLVNENQLTCTHFGEARPETARFERSTLERLARLDFGVVASAAIAVARTAKTSETSEPASAD